jgi:hypothetical protein
VDENGLHGATPDYAAAYAAGVRFVYLRKSHSFFARGKWVLTHDEDYARFAAAARAAGIVVGAYLFAHYDRTAPALYDQVQMFQHSPGSVLPGVDLPPALDVEFIGRGVVDTGLSKDLAALKVLDFIDELKDTFGTPPAIYSSHVQLHDENCLGGKLAQYTSATDKLVDCPLWQKVPYRLARGNPPDTRDPYMPHRDHEKADPHDYRRIPEPWARLGHTPWIIQYQGDAVKIPGHSASADLNLFREFSPASVGDLGRREWVQTRVDADVPPATGFVGDWGTTSLRAYQTKHGLPVTGVVDVRTFASLSWVRHGLRAPV